jgi:hypothetical protein
MRDSADALSLDGHDEPALSPRDLLFARLIGERVAELLCPPPTRGLVDAATLAATLGVSRGAIYAHAEELGGRRIGNGPRGRLRFDLDSALAAWTSRPTSKKSQAPQTPIAAGNSPSRGSQRLGSRSELLPIRPCARPLDAGRRRS